jgi:predicted nucleic acid-binding protein
MVAIIVVVIVILSRTLSGLNNADHTLMVIFLDMMQVLAPSHIILEARSLQEALRFGQQAPTFAFHASPPGA